MSESDPNSHPKLMLASSSPYRKDLLARLGLPFSTEAPLVDETPLEGESPQELVMRLAKAKAAAIAKHQPNALIIGSDQAAVLEGAILGKPGDHQNAVAQLSEVSGKTVEFLTSIVLHNSSTGTVQSGLSINRVVFRTLSTTQIEHYLRREQPYNCAGSFKSEALGIALFERLEGDDPNALIGLPLIKLVTMLQQGGIEILAN